MTTRANDTFQKFKLITIWWTKRHDHEHHIDHCHIKFKNILNNKFYFHKQPSRTLAPRPDNVNNNQTLKKLLTWHLFKTWNPKFKCGLNWLVINITRHARSKFNRMDELTRPVPAPQNFKFLGRRPGASTVGIRMCYGPLNQLSLEIHLHAQRR